MEFNYQVKNPAGQISEGVINAPDENTAVSILHNKGFVVFSLNPVKKDLLNVDVNHLFAHVNNKDIVVFTRQLATLVEADMPIAEGLRTLAAQIEKPPFKKVILDVASRVEAGTSLSGALAVYPKFFSSFYIKLTQAGEVSGKLQGSLLYLADYLERSQGINSKIRGALTYPAFVVGALIIVAGIMGVYVLPQLLSVFKDSGITDLPVTTRILIAVTNFVNAYLYYILGVVVIGGFIIVRFIRSAEGKVWLDDIMIKAPAIGIVVRNLFLARIGESLSTLVKSGIPILDSLQITADLVGNTNYRNIMLAAQDQVRGGGKISEILIQHAIEIPPLFASMVSIGERTGKLDYMLEHVAKFYKSESENTINTITQLLEPVIVLILGFAVAILVSSILLPIYSLVGGS
ncbi:MAG TPA: type II secretion system F family protein [Candidatus Paceibacterota bacterium]|nr:type II secretion system F family protein [Candidatus Paceibacterota bacterium]